MADLLVRGVDESVVPALKERAGEHGRFIPPPLPPNAAPEPETAAPPAAPSAG